MELKKLRIAAFAAGIVCAACAFATAEDVRLDVSVNRTQIYVGESAMLTVKVAGMNRPPEPDVSKIKGFRVQLLGSQSDSRHSISIVNGRVQRESFSGRTFTYELTPEDPGTFIAGPVTVNARGRTLKASGPAVTVAGLEKQNWVTLSVEASRSAVLVDEPFEITLNVDLLRLRGRYAAVDPLDPSTPPKLEVDFLNNVAIEGLESPDIAQSLQKHLVSGPQGAGFAINNYTLRNNPFDFRGFFGGLQDERMAKFVFPRRTVTREKRTYHRYSLTLKYTAKEQGAYTFGPAVFKGLVLTSVDAAGNPVTQPVLAVGPAVTVRVTPPPEEGRPASFTGAVGSNLVVNATLDTQTCKVGDPLQLTLALTGSFNSRNVHPPVLGKHEALARDFRVYDDNVQTEKTDDGIRYVYTIRPTTAGTLELPPIEVSYYDIRSRVYRRAVSPPVPVRAREAAEVAETIILSTATGAVVQAQSAEEAADAAIPAPLDASPRGAVPARILYPRQHLLLAACGPAVYAFLLLLRTATTGVARYSRAGRRRKAVSEAMAALQEARHRAASEPQVAGRLICEAMGLYLRTRFHAAPGELTPSNVRSVLQTHGIDPATRECFGAVFERTFNAAFTPSAPGGGAEDASAALEVIEQLEDNGAR